jgi:hypothetical protein
MLTHRNLLAMTALLFRRRRSRPARTDAAIYAAPCRTARAVQRSQRAGRPHGMSCPESGAFDADEFFALAQHHR